jgi:AmmeMemoRadiSam system protein B
MVFYFLVLITAFTEKSSKIFQGGFMRKPAVADRFYSGSPNELRKTVSGLLQKTDPHQSRKKCIAAVSPHAGYIYSGELAARTLGSIIIPETVVLIGPNHHGTGAPVALSACSWALPFGSVPVDEELEKHVFACSPHIDHDE